MTILEDGACVFRIKLLADRGFDARVMSSEELLAIAIDLERTAKDIGPFDPAHSLFIQRSQDALAAAALAEALE